MEPPGRFFHLKTVFLIISPALVFGYLTDIPDEDYGHVDIQLEESDWVPGTAPPWLDRHIPPPTPYLPPIPQPTNLEFEARNSPSPSICTMSACNCNSRQQDGEVFVDISCKCSGKQLYQILVINEGMLPTRADSLEITDCQQVHLTGTEPVPETPDEEESRGSRRSSRKKKARKISIPGGRAKRNAEDGREGVTNEAAEEDGGVEWEEAVWEAVMGSPDNEDQYVEEEKEEEEEEDMTTLEGEESEKGGRYARSAPTGDRNEPHPLSSLIIRRVKELRMASHAVGGVRRVLFEDIKRIHAFPPYAFQPEVLRADLNPLRYLDTLSSPSNVDFWEMESVTFKNISDIEKFSANSFSWVQINSHFYWVQTNVVIMEMDAIKIFFRPVDQGADSVDPCVTSYSQGDGAAKKVEGGVDVVTKEEQGIGSEGMSDRKDNSINLDVDQEPLATEYGRNELEELKTKCDTPLGSFTVAVSVISRLYMKAITVQGPRSVTFDGCQMAKLGPSSISIRDVEYFSFTRNSVMETVSMYAFEVNATFVEIRRNRFERLDEGAFAGIKLATPNIEESRLAFEENLFMEVGLLSLHPAWNVFGKFNHKGGHQSIKGISFRRNAFADCSCPHMGWIVMIADQREGFSGFYAQVLKDESENYCAREPIEPMGLILPCRLPLRGIRSLFAEDGMTCKKLVDVEGLCKMYESAASFETVNSLCVWATIALVSWVVYRA